MKLKYSTLFPITISILIVLNTFGAIIERLTGISSIVFTAIPDIVLFLLILIYKKRIKGNLAVWVMLSVSIFVSIIHVIFGGIILYETKYLLYIISFLAIITGYCESFWDAIEKTTYAMSLFLCIDALWAAPKAIATGYGLRVTLSFTMFDKSYYTSVLSLAWVFIFTKLLFSKVDEQTSRFKNKSMYRFLLILLLLILFYVNGVIIASKMFLIEVILSFFITIIQAEGKQKRHLSLYLTMGIFILSMIVILSPSIIPEYIYVFLNRYLKVFGRYVNRISNLDRLSITYVTRAAIYRYCLELIKKNMFFGIGFGMYSQIGGNLITHVSQTESSWINLLVEGGLFYFINHLLFVLYLLWIAIKKNRAVRDRHSYMVLLALFVYITINVFNDYYSSIYWVILGGVYSSSYSYERRKLRNNSDIVSEQFNPVNQN